MKCTCVCTPRSLNVQLKDNFITCLNQMSITTNIYILYVYTFNFICIKSYIKAQYRTVHKLESFFISVIYLHFTMKGIINHVKWSLLLIIISLNNNNKNNKPINNKPHTWYSFRSPPPPPTIPILSQH